LNGAVTPKDEEFLKFVVDITAIASQLPVPVVPRPEQFVLMYLILGGMNGFNATLLQLSTGTGKSYMFGLLAHYLNLFHNKKMVVVVPNEVLAAIQQ
jgi:superfamily II DNA or RNA helicase